MKGLRYLGTKQAQLVAAGERSGRERLPLQLVTDLASLEQQCSIWLREAGCRGLGRAPLGHRRARCLQSDAARYGLRLRHATASMPDAVAWGRSLFRRRGHCRRLVVWGLSEGAKVVDQSRW